MKLTRIALAVSGVLALASCGGGGGGEKTYSTTPASPEPVYAKPSMSSDIPMTDEGAVAFADIGVHDPSVVKAGSDYYIFGSHLAAAKSSDLINWEYVSVLSGNGSVDESPLFNTYSTEIAEGIAWTDGYKGNWAADVIQAPNGKYWFYYNHCAQTEADNGGCWNRSYLGLAEADSVEGPYVNKGVFLRSGYRTEAEFTSYPLDNGQTTWNGAVDPNVIDPAAFFDKNGGLWMVYGSYSGGIFVLEMDTTTGKPKAGQGYGKRLLGGDFRAIEGAFVMYSPVADYYYLFYSVAGFAANDGYNIRIARSKNPNGPYLDPAGVDIATTGGLEIGGKLLGGFEFTETLGEADPSWGYQSPGHNSAIYDAATKRHLLVTHTRFPTSATAYPTVPEAHAVRTHEMFVNNEGWLVVSPERYVPLAGDNVVDVAEVPGHYKFVNQGTGVNKAAIKSGYVTLHSNRTVSGSDKGTWTIQGDNSIKLTLDSDTYFGVLKWQWDNGLKKLVPVFTAMSRKGASVFGTRTDAIADTAAALNTVSEALDVKSELTLADEGYSLPTVGKSGTQISWDSSNEYFIDSAGNLFIPTPDLGDQNVTLTANMELDGQTFSKAFNVTVKARPEFKNAIAHYTFENVMTDSMGNLAAAKTTDNNLVNVDVGAPTYTTGYAGQGYDFNGANGVRLPDDIIKSSDYTVAFWVNAESLTDHTPAFFGATDVDHWFSYIPGKAWFTSAQLIWSNYLGNWNQVVAATSAPVNQWQHVAITYTGGMMNMYINGALAGSMPRDDIFTPNNGGLFALGVNFGWDLPFVGQIDELIVYDYALSSLDINGAAINNLTDPSQFAGFVKDALELGDMSAVRENFELVRVGPFVSGISWTSSDEKYLKPTNGTAVVNQPTADEGDKTITLTAHIKYQDFTDTKDFEVTIKSLAPAEYSFEGDLSSVNAVAAAGTVTGDRMNNTGGAVSYVEGIKGSALNLDGTSGVRLPDNLITTNSYTISMWLKPTAFTDYTTAFFGGANGNYWLSLVPSMAGTAKTRVWANGPSFYDNAELANRIPVGQWSHIVIMVDGENNNTIKLYVNGALQLESPDFRRVMTVAGDTNEFALGVNYWDTPFNGAIDELKVFTGTISAEKINSLYQEGAAQ
ncbi:LamG-like jellyroll fold domain-containing protein [Cellvibrio sp. NN19]|uniref:LamG-like jellyroll fold domain-containing protein n=1 Tax=Cellvibrio chitinivorans TaxID=3102792 RepID=UPI002B417DD9|nr:LamG-like jellyroll fold domain-containing protein [Cellvibrio sp. NN19]